MIRTLGALFLLASITVGYTQQSKSKLRWASWLGPTSDGKSAETGLLKSFPESGPEELWRVQLGSGFSGISVADGRAFTQFGRDGREFVMAVDAGTGRELWRFESGPDFAQGRSFGPRASPVVDGERLYTISGFGKLVCSSVTDGREIWASNPYDTYRMRQHEEGHSPTPIVDGDRLIVAAGNSVFAFDKSDAKLLWRALDEKINHSTPRLASIGDRQQLLVLTTQNFVGLDPENGAELWRTEHAGVTIATPVVGPDDLVFTGAAYGFGSQLTKVDGNSARQVFRNNSLATHHATAIVRDGYLYGFHDRIGIMKCVDFATGEEIWENRGRGKGKLIFADGQLIILTESGELLLAPATPDGFTPTAQTKILSGLSYTAPTLVDGRLYLRSDKEMVCISIR